MSSASSDNDRIDRAMATPRVSPGVDLALTMSPGTVTGLFEELRRVIREVVREELSAQTAKLSAVNEKDRAQDALASAPDQGLSAARGVELPPTEKIKARDLRTALLLGKVPEDAGLLIDLRTAARLLCISPRTFERLVALHAAPQPIRLAGRTQRWRLAELLEWVEAGCPNLKHWTYPATPRVRAKSRR